MAFDIVGAKNEGYTDAEIADHLGQTQNFKVNAARDEGYSDQEIIGHLLGKTDVGVAGSAPPVVASKPVKLAVGRESGPAIPPLAPPVNLRQPIGIAPVVSQLSDNPEEGTAAAQSVMPQYMRASEAPPTPGLAPAGKPAPAPGIIDRVWTGIKNAATNAVTPEPGTPSIYGREATMQDAKDLAASAAKLAMGVADVSTIGLLHPQIEKANQALQNLGVTPSLAQSRLPETAGSMAGFILPWAAVSKAMPAITGISNAVRAGRIINQAATGGAIGGAYAQNTGEDAIPGAIGGAALAGTVQGIAELPGALKDAGAWWNTRKEYNTNEARGMIVRDFDGLKASGLSDEQAVKVMAGKQWYEDATQGETARFNPVARSAMAEDRMDTEYGRRDTQTPGDQPAPATGAPPQPVAPIGEPALVPEVQPQGNVTSLPAEPAPPGMPPQPPVFILGGVPPLPESFVAPHNIAPNIAESGGDLGGISTAPVSEIASVPSEISPAPPVPAEVSAQLADARNFKYKTDDHESMIEYGEKSADPFYTDLFSFAYPKAKAYNDIMTTHKGQPEGVEYTNDAGDRYAYVTPDATEEEKFRVQYFDKDGFSSHATRDTREQALEEMIDDGFRTEAKGALDKLSGTPEFQRGNEVSSLISKLNSGEIDHAEFVRRRDALYQEGEKASSATANPPATPDTPDIPDTEPREPGDYTLAAKRPLLTKGDIKTVADITQAYKDGNLAYAPGRAGDGNKVLYKDVADKSKVDASMAAIPAGSKITVGKDKVTITVKAQPLTEEEQTSNEAKATEKLAQAAASEKQAKEWSANGFTSEELELRELTADTPETKALRTKELNSAMAGAYRRATALREEATDLADAKSGEAKHVFWFNDTPEAVTEKADAAGAELFQGQTRNEPAVYKEARQMMKGLAKVDKDFAENPVFTVTKTTDKQGVPTYRLEYNNGPFHLSLKPDAFGFEMTGKGPEAVLTKAIDQGESVWKEGDRITLSPGYLEGKSDQVYILPSEKLAGSDFYSATPFADTPGEDAPRPGTGTREPMGNVPGETAEGAQSLKVMRLPEIIKLAKAIMGGNPKIVRAIRKNLNIRGVFFAKDGGYIQVRADLMQTPGQMEKTVAHEVGHLADYSPDRDMARGNILGHIATLHNYTKSMLEEYPGSPNRVITDADRDRLHKEALKQVRAEEEKGAKTIIEEITREEPIFEQTGLTPEMVLSIWNSVADAREVYPELYKFVAGMTSAQKKAIMIQAMKGMVAPELAHLGGTGKQIGTRTVTEKRTVVYPAKKATAADIAARFEKLLKEEIEKRGLYEKEVILKELKDLSYEWRPLPPNPPPVYMRYRNKNTELYADAISALLNSPGFLNRKAPSFTKAFFSYMERKPEFEAAYNDIQATLNGDFKDMAKGYVDDTREMFQRAQDERNRIAKIPEPTRSIIDTLRTRLENEAWAAEKIALEVEKRGKAADKVATTPQEKEAAQTRIAEARRTRKLIEDMAYLPSETKGLMHDLYDDIINPAAAAGVSVEDLGLYMSFDRILGEEGGKASFKGHTYETAQIALAKLRDEWKGGKFDAAEKYRERFFRVWRRDQILSTPGIEHFLKPDQLKDFRENSSYSRNNVVNYLEKNFGNSAMGRFKVYERIGSFEDIENPFVATVIQDLSLRRAIAVNNAKLSLMQTLYDADEIEPAEMRYSADSKKMVPVEPGAARQQSPLRKYQDILSVAIKGKVHHFYVDKEIARLFQFDPVVASNLAKFASAVAQPFRSILVTHNPVFQIRNPIRDFLQTWKHNQELGFSDLAPLLKTYAEVFPEVREYAMNGKASPLIKEMLKNKVLPANRIWSVKDMDAMDELKRIADSFVLDPDANKDAAGAANRLKRIWDYLDRTGNTTELLGKVAGYKHMRGKAGLSDDDLAMRTREMIGTPNWKKKGTWAIVTNNLFLFSTVNIRGIQAGYRSAKAGPGMFTWKTLVGNLLNRAMLKLAALGLLGYTASQRDHFKKIVDRIPNADKTNYTILPLYMDKNGKAVYWRIPEDYTGQFFGQMATALMDANLTGKGGVTDALDSTNPYQLSNFLTIPYMLGRYYLKNENTYDSFYQRNTLSDDEMKAGGKDAAKALAEETWNQSGLQTLHKFDRSAAQRDQDALEKALNTFPGNMLGTFLKKSDAGLREVYDEGIQGAQQKDARERLAARRTADKIVNKEELTAEDRQGWGRKKDAGKNAVRHKVFVKEGDYLLDALIRSKTKGEKRAIVDAEQKRKGQNNQ